MELNAGNSSYGKWGPLPSCIFFLLLVLLFSCERKADEGEKIQQLKLEISLPDSLNSGISIVNPGPDTAFFTLDFGADWHVDMADLLQSIRQLPDQVPGEGLERKAWRYVSSHSRNTQPLSDELILHHPLIFLNGPGEGFCDDQASALALIWRELGFPARVWVLEGHVVPEVQVNGKWHMYDPSFQNYYLTDEGAVAAVEDLAAHPEWIQDQDPAAPFYPSALAFGGSSFLADLFRSSENNRIEPSFDSLPPFSTWNFTLTPGMKLTFCSGFPPPFYGPVDPSIHFVEIRLPEGFSGRISLPLAVHEIRGQGSVFHQGEEISTPRSWDRDLQLLQDMDFREVAPEGLLIRCYLNPLYSLPKKQQSLSLTGKGLGQLKISALSLPEELAVQRSEEMKRQAAFHRMLKQLLAADSPSTDALPIQNGEDLKNALLGILRQIPDGDPEYLEQKFQDFWAKLDENGHQEMLMVFADGQAQRFLLGMLLAFPVERVLEF